MKNQGTIVAVCMLFLGLAGCADSSHLILTPETPRFDSSSEVESEIQLVQSENVTTVVSIDGTTVESENAAERNGHTYGSGN